MLIIFIINMNNFNPTFLTIVNSVKPQNIVYLGGLFTFTLCFYKILKKILRICVNNIDCNINEQLEQYEKKFNNLLNDRQFNYLESNNVTNNVNDSDSDSDKGEENNNNEEEINSNDNKELVIDNDNNEDSNEEDNNAIDKKLIINNEEMTEQIEEEKLEEKIVSLITDLNNGSNKINAIINELETIVTIEDINDILKEEYTIEEKRDLINKKIHTKITEFINNIENNNTEDIHIKCERSRNIIEFDDKEKKKSKKCKYFTLNKLFRIITNFCL